MKPCPFENYFAGYISGELDNSKIVEFQSHLLTCSTCPKKLNEFSEALYFLKSQKRKNPPPGLIKEYHENLDSIFTESNETNQWSRNIENIFQTIFWRRSLSFKIAEVVGFVIIGIFIGWLIFSPQPEIQQNPNLNPDYFTRPISKEEVEYINYYFQAAELLLLEIKNIDNNEKISYANIEFHKEITQKLLIKTFIVHEIALRQNDPKILRFLSKMELLLYEISNQDKEELASSLSSFTLIIDDTNLLDHARTFQNHLINFKNSTSKNISNQTSPLSKEKEEQSK